MAKIVEAASKAKKPSKKPPPKKPGRYKRRDLRAEH